MYWYILVYLIMAIMITLLSEGGRSCLAWSENEK